MPKLKNICQNRKAWHDYSIVEKLQCGIVLTGTEVKSCRANSVVLGQAYIHFDSKGNAQLTNCNIAPYAMGNLNNHEPVHDRQLLLHKKELGKLKRAVEAKGMTIVPLEMYFTERGKVKLDIAIARGKNAADKRESLKEQMDRRETQRVLKGMKNS